jgi:hypothetical protein
LVPLDGNLHRLFSFVEKGFLDSGPEPPEADISARFFPWAIWREYMYF